MRQTLFAALLILTLPLTACAAGDDQDISPLLDSLRESDIACEAEVTAVTDGEENTFTLACADSDGGYRLTVLAPERIAGVEASVGADLTVSFDGLVLPLPLDESRPSAVTALPALLSALRGAHLDLVWREGEYRIAQFLPRDDLALRVWLSPEDAPVYAELIENGTTAVRCTVTSWNIKTKEVPYESDNPNLGGDQSRHPGA